MFRDYEFLCGSYGPSGASGVRPCLFCLETKKSFQLPLEQHDPSKQRTLESLQRDHEFFMADGALLNRAKDYNNVIRPALLPIPLQWVCILALHLDLGIFPWIRNVMIADWRELDGQLAAHLGNTGCIQAAAIPSPVQSP